MDRTGGRPHAVTASAIRRARCLPDGKAYCPPVPAVRLRRGGRRVSGRRSRQEPAFSSRNDLCVRGRGEWSDAQGTEPSGRSDSRALSRGRQAEPPAMSGPARSPSCVEPPGRRGSHAPACMAGDPARCRASLARRREGCPCEGRPAGFGPVQACRAGRGCCPDASFSAICGADPVRGTRAGLPGPERAAPFEAPVLPSIDTARAVWRRVALEPVGDRDYRGEAPLGEQVGGACAAAARPADEDARRVARHPVPAFPRRPGACDRHAADKTARSRAPGSDWRNAEPVADRPRWCRCRFPTDRGSSMTGPPCSQGSPTASRRSGHRRWGLVAASNIPANRRSRPSRPVVAPEAARSSPLPWGPRGSGASAPSGSITPRTRPKEKWSSVATAMFPTLKNRWYRAVGPGTLRGFTPATSVRRPRVGNPLQVEGLRAGRRVVHAPPARRSWQAQGDALPGPDIIVLPGGGQKVRMAVAFALQHLVQAANGTDCAEVMRVGSYDVTIRAITARTRGPDTWTGSPGEET